MLKALCVDRNMIVKLVGNIEDVQCFGVIATLLKNRIYLQARSRKS